MGPGDGDIERALYGDRNRISTSCGGISSNGSSACGARRGGAPDWAAKTHFSTAPAYYQNYLLGEILATQLQAHLLEVTGGWERYVMSPEVARFLNERLFSIGRSTDWRGAIEHATGRPLDVAPFLAELDSA